MEAESKALTVAVVNEYDFVTREITSLLSPFDRRVRLVDLDGNGNPTAPANVALCDTFAGRRRSLQRAAALVGGRRADHVVLYTSDAGPEFVREAKQTGASGVVLKTRSGDALVETLERIAGGERIGLEPTADGQAGARAVELSDRESEVLALIARGLTNSEIGEELYLSVETVKTYVKRLYAKLGIHNRAQAAAAAASHQLVPRRTRG